MSIENLDRFHEALHGEEQGFDLQNRNEQPQNRAWNSNNWSSNGENAGEQQTSADSEAGKIMF